MGERTGNLSRRASIGIFIIVLLGLLLILVTPAEPTLASMKPAPLAGMGIPFRTAAGPCIDKAKRYNDCGNGTITDSVTGLIWLKQADCLATKDWETAKKAAAGLKNGDCIRLGRGRGVDLVFSSDSSDEIGDSGDLKPVRMIAPDETAFQYLAGRPYAPSGAMWDQALRHWRAPCRLTELPYDRVLRRRDTERW